MKRQLQNTIWGSIKQIENNHQSQGIPDFLRFAGSSLQLLLHQYLDQAILPLPLGQQESQASCHEANPKLLWNPCNEESQFFDPCHAHFNGTVMFIPPLTWREEKGGNKIKEAERKVWHCSLNYALNCQKLVNPNQVKLQKTIETWNWNKGARLPVTVSLFLASMSLPKQLLTFLTCYTVINWFMLHYLHPKIPFPLRLPKYDRRRWDWWTSHFVQL